MVSEKTIHKALKIQKNYKQYPLEIFFILLPQFTKNYFCFDNYM